jgi:hypothetical protein
MDKKSAVHVPGPSLWPIVTAAGLGLIAVGVVSSFVVSLVGIAVLLAGTAGWTMENRAEEEHHDE